MVLNAAYLIELFCIKSGKMLLRGEMSFGIVKVKEIYPIVQNLCTI